VATLTGNPQNMIVGTHSGWSYAGFALRMLPVAAGGLVIDWAFLRWRFRESLPREPFSTRPGRPRVRKRLLVKGLAVTAFVLAGFLAGRGLSGMAMAGAAVMIVIARVPPGPLLERLNWSLLVFFSGLFVVVAGLNQAGWGEVFFRASAAHLGQTPLTQLVTFSGVVAALSNVVSNVPLVLVAVPWVPRLANPPLTWLALAMASTLAGNLTLVGSVANVIVAELARGRARLGFREFLVAGVPVTLLTLAWGVAVLALYAVAG
jgi:Na+/H+ antiporter NhaD/arsenite permease-like protein